MTATDSTTATAAPAATNLYLQGPFAPVQEEVTVTDLDVTGKIPETLDGRYLRIGPNPIGGDADPATYHWFAGDGMVHGIRLRDGRAEWYRNRWVRSSKVASLLGEPFRQGAVAGDADYAANTNVIGHDGRTYALVEGGPLPFELTDELDTVGPCDFEGTLPGGYTAHPHRDPVSGELHAAISSAVAVPDARTAATQECNDPLDSSWPSGELASATGSSLISPRRYKSRATNPPSQPGPT